MPVDDDINLDDPEGITSEDIRRMDEQADELERIADNAEKNSDRILEAKKKLEGMTFAEKNILDKILDDRRQQYEDEEEEKEENEDKFKLKRDKELDEFEKEEEEKEENSREKRKNEMEGIKDNKENDHQEKLAKTQKDESAKGMSREELADLVIDILKELEKSKKERTENKKGVEENKRGISANEKKFAQIKSDTQSAMGNIQGMRSSPINFGKSKILGTLGKLGIYGAIASFAIQMAEQVYNSVLSEIKAQFEAGGVWDRRKYILDVVGEYNSIDYLRKVKSGQVIFTADAGQDLRQGAPRGVFNTRDLRDGHLRFMQTHFNE